MPDSETPLISSTRGKKLSLRLRFTYQASDPALTDNETTDHAELAEYNDDVDENDEDASSRNIDRHTYGRSDLTDLSYWKRPTVAKIGAVLALFELGMGVAGPLEQLIYYKLACQSLDKSGKCDRLAAQKIVTNFVMGNEIITHVISIATAAKIGQLLDVYGRKIFLLIFAVAAVLGKALIYWAMSSSDGMPRLSMWAGLVVTLMFGGLQGLNSLCRAYVAETNTPKTRTYAMGLAMVYLNFGTLGGPLLLNILQREKTDEGNTANVQILLGVVSGRDLLPLRVGIAVLAILAFYCIVLLPELRSVRDEKKSQEAMENAERSLSFWRRATPPLHALVFPKLYFSRKTAVKYNRARSAVALLICTNCVLLMISEVVVTLSKQYTVFRYHWELPQLARYFALNGVCNLFMYSVVSPLLLKFLLPGLGFQSSDYVLDEIDTALLLCTSLVNAVMVFARAFAPTTWTFLGVCAMDSFSVLSAPGLLSALAKFYPTSKMGELYGALAFTQSALAIVSTPILSKVFTLGTHVGFAGLPFVVLAPGCVAGTIMVWTARRMCKR